MPQCFAIERASARRRMNILRASDFLKLDMACVHVQLNRYYPNQDLVCSVLFRF